MKRKYRAQAALEFALAMPILMLLIMGVLDAGREVVASISLNNAAREGARFAALHVYDGTCSTLNCQAEVQTVVDDVALGVDTAEIQPFSVSVSPPIVGVTLKYPFVAMTPLISAALGDVLVTADSSMLAR